MRDLHGLRRAGGSGGQLLQGDVGLGGPHRVDVGSRAQVLDRDHPDAALVEQRRRRVERVRRGSPPCAEIMPHDGLGVAPPRPARSVRGVGWCSIVTDAPRIQMACTAGAMSTG